MRDVMDLLQRAFTAEHRQPEVLAAGTQNDGVDRMGFAGDFDGDETAVGEIEPQLAVLEPASGGCHAAGDGFWITAAA